MPIHLLIATEAPDESRVQTRFGGRPLVSSQAHFDWPHCECCSLPLQFLGQLSLTGETTVSRLVLLFMCAGDEVCSTWEPEGGANRALLVTSAHTELCDPPITDATTLRAVSYGGRVEACKNAGYDDARAAWAEAHGVSPRLVLGQYGGEPQWLQADDTPTCECGKPMDFVAQLEAGPDYHSEMNFGGGCAYVFCCGDHAAKLLWQQ